MKLEGRLFKQNLTLRETTVERVATHEAFTVQLEHALVDLCRQLDVPIPLWLSKNTHEFAAFRQTIFFSDQFTENVIFDRFQIRLLEM